MVLSEGMDPSRLPGIGRLAPSGRPSRSGPFLSHVLQGSCELLGSTCARYCALVSWGVRIQLGVGSETNSDMMPMSAAPLPCQRSGPV